MPLPSVTMCESLYAVIEAVGVDVIVTQWDAFPTLDLKRAKDLANALLMVGLRNVYRLEDVRIAGFAYVSVGRH